jgi:hypothetical protein
MAPKKRMRTEGMAALIAASGCAGTISGFAALKERGEIRRRKISPEAGRALEILGHAIEYLADEYAHCGGALSAHDGCLTAMQLLMKINRQIYFACPEAPSLADRWRALLGLRAV